MFLSQCCFPQGICLVVGLLGHMVVLFLVFLKNLVMFSIVGLSICILPAGQEGSLFSTPAPAFIVCRLFNDGHSDWYEARYHYSFDFHLSNKEPLDENETPEINRRHRELSSGLCDDLEGWDEERGSRCVRVQEGGDI